MVLFTEIDARFERADGFDMASKVVFSDSQQMEEAGAVRNTRAGVSRVFYQVCHGFARFREAALFDEL